jgi:hypothetical protein
MEICFSPVICLEGLRKTTIILRLANVSAGIWKKHQQNASLERHRHANTFPRLHFSEPCSSLSYNHWRVRYFTRIVDFSRRTCTIHTLSFAQHFITYMNPGLTQLTPARNLHHSTFLFILFTISLSLAFVISLCHVPCVMQ